MKGKLLMNKVIVIGGGASGLAAAIAAAENGAKVTVVEKNNKAGKKLLVTGNGRCNITNTDMSVSKYRGENLSFVKEILERYSTNDIIRFFESIALMTKDINGYVYPSSLQAQTVVDKLVGKCLSLGVKVALGTECTDIEKTDDGRFIVKTPNYNYDADRVIVATGLVAGVNIKGDKVSDNDIFAVKFAKKMGHRINNVVPALTGLKCKNNHQSKVGGVRWESRVSTYIDNVKVYEDRGELQFADYGISGIVVFQNARFASLGLKNRQNTEVEIDMIPDISVEECKKMLKCQFDLFNSMSIYDILTGMFNSKLVSYILANAGINGSIKARDLKDVSLLVKTIKEHRMPVTGTRGFEFAQVCAGGIDTGEIKATMESKNISGLYFVGEALDVDGMCGGYNLHFAFASGLEAGKNAGKVDNCD